jgi:CBS domain-containing protein
MTVETIMTRKVVCVAPDATIADVIGKLYAYKISCVVVCEGELPVGLISERDVVGVAMKLVAGKAETREQAGDLMSTALTTVQPGDSLDAALALAIEQRIRHLPVIDDRGWLVGLVTQSDLLRALRGA